MSDDTNQRKPKTYGVLPPEVVRGLDGLTLLQRWRTGEWPSPPISEGFDFDLIGVERGRVTFRGQPSWRFLNPLGGIHGGWYATMLDSCMGCAVHSTLPKGVAYVSAELKVNFIRAIPADGGPIEAIGHVTHSGRRMAFAEGKLVDAAGKLYATGSTTCFVFEAE